MPAALLREVPEAPDAPLVLVSEVDFLALVLSLDFALDFVPEVPDESVAPVMPAPLDVEEPDEPEPVPVDELCAIAMLLPKAEISSAIKSFFICCLHR